MAKPQFAEDALIFRLFVTFITGELIAKVYDYFTNNPNPHLHQRYIYENEIMTNYYNSLFEDKLVEAQVHLEEISNIMSEDAASFELDLFSTSIDIAQTSTDEIDDPNPPQ